jgi:hypothetical protein
MQHVPLQDRLASARVCQTWREAAALATSSIQRIGLSAPKLPGLQSWLQQHGQQLTSLDLVVTAVADSTVLQLPELRQLHSLGLSGCKLQLQSAAHRQRTRSAARSPVVLLPHLTSLVLKGFVLSTSSTLLQLTRVTTLHSLELCGVQITLKLQQRPKQLSQALSAVLQCNMQLTRLHVRGLVLEDTALAAVSGLQRLQDCCLGICDSRLCGSWTNSVTGNTSPGLLSGLPPSLTSLCVKEGRDEYDSVATHATLPRHLPQLTALKQLELESARFCPAALAAMNGLQQLRLDSCSWMGDGAAGAAAGDEFSQGVAALLAAVGQMLQLEVLCVESFFLEASLNCPDLPVLSCSALTASTCLQKLHLSTEDTAPLPLGDDEGVLVLGLCS